MPARSTSPSARAHVAIANVCLPNQSAAGTAADIRGVAPDARILIISTPWHDETRAAAVAAGCTGFITQDESTADLVTAVRQLAAGGSYMPSLLMSKLMPRLGTSYRGIGADLTAREHEVLELLSTGATTLSMASQLFVSVNTIRQHVQRILFKLSAHSKLEASQSPFAKASSNSALEGGLAGGSHADAESRRDDALRLLGEDSAVERKVELLVEEVSLGRRALLEDRNRRHVRQGLARDHVEVVARAPVGAEEVQGADHVPVPAHRNPEHEPVAGLERDWANRGQRARSAAKS